MATYRAEALSPTGWTSAEGIQNQVQQKLDAYAQAGWRLVTMANVAGTGAILGGAIGPYLLLVFESG